MKMLSASCCFCGCFVGSPPSPSDKTRAKRNADKNGGAGGAKQSLKEDNETQKVGLAVNGIISSLDLSFVSDCLYVDGAFCTI